ncbi:vWA domain-containing protein [uncultured Gimesia sp.]|uniref:vWA domain-containing protein n=1 Tax=uncultured Gimesia sp. TaxID=1678688 RepID=UPI00262E5159|nr:vWA domain-containing protein [uncultured Gimesia sp.]
MHTHQTHSSSNSQWYQGVSVSTLFHLIILCGLAMMVDHRAEITPSSSANSIQTRWAPPHERKQPVLLELTAVTTSKEHTASASALTKLPLVHNHNSAPDTKNLASILNGPLLQTIQNEESLTTKYAADYVGALLTSSTIGLSSSGSGNGIGNGGFFGHKPKARKIVYVVDSSKSMNFPHDSVGKTRLGRVKIELANAILSMDENQEFFVIFFSDFAIPMPARQLQPATPRSKKKFLSWVAKVPGLGTTEPFQALMLALRLQPDTIYFLTDGQFDPSIVRAFNKAAGKTQPNRKIIVNGICLGNREGEQVIRELTENNSGSYTFIP